MLGGGELTLTYALGDRWAFGVGAGFRRKRFRLDDSAVIDVGVAQEESTVASLRLTWTSARGRARIQAQSHRGVPRLAGVETDRRVLLNLECVDRFDGRAIFV